ncbi:pseudoazurin domain-containing protein [Campylobacter vulpis]|uniref:pseudoazurin n=1 Tax=Campylobacter vulpis TaxID=1655500 RepID=UPI000C161855|nr:pseudoazurin [Campylobacter vulpis]MBS4276104.1 pseudoazurin [Campylobacter vulpis]MBS4307519.1 pseudoazurin [Campylobacter vulpis]MBS4423976.1 pseudoazurin [Campylobacter vulpis]PHY89443.1 pseudoazurin [Campylobacter vulpis]QNF77272.1 pseudoazurin domain-containing protein [Campylobacter vulpis]
MKFVVKIVLLGLFMMSLEAKNYEVKMLDLDSENQTMIFEPAVLHIEVGDSVTFIPTHKSHWAKSIIVPEGASKFESKLDEKATFTFEKEGVYLYECPPHRMMNMVGLIQVGKAQNLDKIKNAVPKLEKRVVTNQGRLEAYVKELK